MINPPMEASAFATWLKDHGACREALEWQSGKTLRETWDTCERGNWLGWLLMECGYEWTDTASRDLALAEYVRVTEAAYQCALDTALADGVRGTLAEYERAVEIALAEYFRVRATVIRKIIPFPFKENEREAAK